jgi:hypothetical protein
MAASAGCPKDIPEIPVLNPKLSDEEQVMRLLDEVWQGMENQRIYQVMTHVSRSYQDRDGRDYDALAAYLNKVFDEYRSIRIARVKPRIVVQGNQARAVETFGTIAKPDSRSDYPPIDLHGQVTVFFEKVDGRWLIVEWGSIR